MTSERAKYILSNCRYGEFPMAFRRKCDLGSSPLDPNGITEAEDAEIRQVWDTMPGDTNYTHAVQRIARSGC